MSVSALLEAAGVSGETESPGYPPISLRYFHHMPPQPTKWIINGIVPEESCLLVGAEEKSGKTWLLLELAIALAANRPALDRWEPSRQGTALIVSPEGSRMGLPNRLHGLCSGKHVVAAEVGPRIPLWPGGINLLDGLQVEQLRQTLGIVRPDILVLDPLVTMTGGADENSSGEVQSVLNTIRNLLPCSPGMSILVSHHLAKGKDGKSPWHALRGSSALGAWADGLVTIKRETEESDSVRKVNVWHRDNAPPSSVRFRMVFDPSGGPVDGVPSVMLDTDC